MGALIQKTVLFYGDELVAIQVEDSGSIYVPLSRLCDNLGIERKRQAQRIRDHEVLNRGLLSLTLETTGGAQEAQCLRLDLIPLWLAGVNANRVSPEVRAKLVQYQAEAASVLWAAFRHDILPHNDPAMSTTEPSGAALAYEIATAIQHLARQQMELEQRLGGRFDKMALWAREFSQNVDRRLATLELQVAPQATVTEQQATEVALAVKAVGHALAQQGTKPGYSQVYAELYRRYGISSYKNLPQDKFPHVMSWLHAWHEELSGNHTSKD
jgi:hypothetical protein